MPPPWHHDRGCTAPRHAARRFVRGSSAIEFRYYSAMEFRYYSAIRASDPHLCRGWVGIRPFAAHQAREAAQRSVRLTRSSSSVEAYVGELSTTMRAILLGQPAPEVALAAAARVGVKLDPSTEVPVVACYIDQVDGWMDGWIDRWR